MKDKIKISYMAIPGLKYRECKTLNKVMIRRARILTVLQNETGVTLREMKSKSRDKDVVFCRHLAVWLLKKYTDASVKSIAWFFGGRDRTTGLYAIGRIKNDFNSDIKRANEILFIENLL